MQNSLITHHDTSWLMKKVKYKTFVEDGTIHVMKLNLDQKCEDIENAREKFPANNCRMQLWRNRLQRGAKKE